MCSLAQSGHGRAGVRMSAVENSRGRWCVSQQFGDASAPERGISASVTAAMRSQVSPATVVHSYGGVGRRPATPPPRVRLISRTFAEVPARPPRRQPFQQSIKELPSGDLAISMSRVPLRPLPRRAWHLCPRRLRLLDRLPTLGVARGGREPVVRPPGVFGPE